MRNNQRAIKCWLSEERTRNMTLSIKKKMMRLKEPRWSRSENKLKRRTASAMRKDWSRSKSECTNSLMWHRVARCRVCGPLARQIYGAITYRWINTKTWNAIKKSIAYTKRSWLMAYSRKSRSISELKGSRSMLVNNTCFHSSCLIIEFDFIGENL